MKRLSFLIMFSFFATVGILAQQHLSFMGIRMGGNINDFTRALQAKNVTVTYSGTHDYGTDDDEYWCSLNGDFWMFQNAYILVRAPYIDHGVSSVNVESIRDTKATFNNLIAQMDKKYGKHSVATGNHSPYSYKYTWKLSRGNIIVSRTQFSQYDGKCNLSIEYLDFPYVKRKSQSYVKRRNAHKNDL